MMSIVTTCYNDGLWLPEAVTSVWQQVGDVPALEMCIIDNGSADGMTPAVVEQIAAQDPRITAHRTAHTTQPVALNTAVARTSGEWVVILNADDRLVPDALAMMAHVSRERPDVDCIVSPLQFFGASTELYRIAPYDPATMIDRHQVPGVRAVRRDLWERTGGEDPAIAVGADWDWAVRASLLGMIVYQHATPLWECRKFAEGRRLSDQGDIEALRAHMRSHLMESANA